jgi:oligo-1,6-glucosidase
MTNVPFATADDFLDLESINYFRHATELGADPETVLANLRLGSRDNARSPMQWDAGSQAGFSTGVPWSAVNPNHTDINAGAAVSDDRSVFHHYRRLIALRRSEPAVAHGDFTMLAMSHPTLYAFIRAHEGTELLVVANFSADPLPLDDEIPGLASWGSAELLLGNLPDEVAPTAPLRAWEARILKR